MQKMCLAKFQNTLKLCTYDILLLQHSNTAEIEFNKTDSVRITYRYGALVQPLVQWKAISITYSEFVCVCVCVCVCLCG
jgi:hypothetical protein